MMFSALRTHSAHGIIRPSNLPKLLAPLATLIRFGEEVRRLAENPFQRQLEEARAEWKLRKLSEKRNAP